MRLLSGVRWSCASPAWSRVFVAFTKPLFKISYLATRSSFLIPTNCRAIRWATRFLPIGCIETPITIPLLNGFTTLPGLRCVSPSHDHMPGLSETRSLTQASYPENPLMCFWNYELMCEICSDITFYIECLSSAARKLKHADKEYNRICTCSHRIRATWRRIWATRSRPSRAVCWQSGNRLL